MTAKPNLSPVDPAALLAVELEYAEIKALRAAAPGVEVHLDADATWVVHPQSAWANAAIALRFSAESVELRLDEILARYRANGRGAGFWVSPLATPFDLEIRLKARGLHCRKRFPGMYCALEARPEPSPRLSGLEIALVEDYELFRRHPHPFYGSLRSPRRCSALAAMTELAAQRPRRVWDFVALRDGVPLGFTSVFLGDRGAGKSNAAGIHDVGVLPEQRRKGIAAELLHHACGFAREREYAGAVLIASGLGEGVYRRAGFREAGRIAYWYRQCHTL